MKKIIKDNFGNFLIILLIFLIVVGWIFSGWPQIWEKPPKIQEALAATATYDFSLCGTDCDTSADWWASADDVDVFPFAGSTANRNTHTEATDAQYSAITSSNNTRWTSADPGVWDEIFLWNEMKINEEVSSITQIDLTFEGYLALTANFSIWVKKTGQVWEQSASWVQVGTVQSITGGSETSFTRSITANFSDYIGADGMLTWGVYESVSSEAMNIDYVKADVTYTPTPPVITVGITGSQNSPMYIPSTNNYVGGAFTFVRNTGSANVTQIIITDTGTVNANLNLSNLKLYYETAATCSYQGTETLFGTAISFNTSEKATVLGTMSVGTSQVCVYVVLDVGSGASAGQTIEIEISNPSTEVTVLAGTVTPATPVAIAGTTTLQVPVIPPATWKAAEDTFATTTVGSIVRLRIQVTNTGSGATGYDYRLEYATKTVATCGDIESSQFTAIPITATAEPFEMATSSYIANGDPTTTRLSIPACCTFVTGRIVVDPSNSSGSFTLDTNKYTEFEFVLQATATASGTHCFRLTNVGTSLDQYSVYPELQITP